MAKAKAVKTPKTTTTTDQVEKVDDKPVLSVDISVTGLGPWSYSKAKVLERCPLQFFLKYIRKVKVEGVKSELALVGSAAHRVLELFVVGKSLDASFKETRREFAASISDELWSEKVSTLEYSITEFKRRMDEFHARNPIKKIFTEVRVGVTRQFTPAAFFGDDVFFRGIIDLVLHLENNDAVFIDHKKGGTADFGLKNYNAQLNSQKILFHNGVTPVNGATGGIHFIEAGQIKLGEHHTKAEIEGKLRSTLLFGLEEAVENVINLGFFKHVAGSYCVYCDFRDECKAGNLKKEELETKKIVQLYVQNNKARG